MDPFTIAVATFGIQKLRGKSTKRAFRDAALLAGGAQVLGAGGIGPFQSFGSGAGQISSFGQTGIGQLLNIGGAGGANAQAFKTAELAGNVPAATTVAEGATPEIAQKIASLKDAGLYDTATTSSGGIGGAFGKAGQYVKDNPLKSLVGVSAVAPLLMGGDEDFELPEGVRPEDYKRAMAKAEKQVEGIGQRVDPSYAVRSPSYASDEIYQYNKGGIVETLPKYNKGGINYLPSKVDHDENDTNNYVRATGYVEDGSGNGDKNEDTMLAQLADGEFVSRSDAILGAGIIEGASPQNPKEMRKKGAAFFYDQQAKFKRVYDILNASRKDN